MRELRYRLETKRAPSREALSVSIVVPVDIIV